MSSNHSTTAICNLINSEAWYHTTRDDHVENVKKQGLKLGIETGLFNSMYGDGISLCKDVCWDLPESGTCLFEVAINVSNPLYDVYHQIPVFTKTYQTQKHFYQNGHIVSGYLNGVSKNLKANIARTEKMRAGGFDALLFEEHKHAVLIHLNNIPASSVTFKGC